MTISMDILLIQGEQKIGICFIKKYLQPALDLVNKYNLSSYMKQSIELTKRYIDSVFGKELEKQEGLGKWF